MANRNHGSSIWLTIVAAILCASSLVAFLPSPTQIALAELPPRPLPQPVAQPTAQPAPAGASIELDVQFPPTWSWTQVHWQALWTAVQWQDVQGAWHDVEGWQGVLDEFQDGEGKKVWWVAKADLGKGPFRWVIYQDQGDDPLATSEPFYLPSLAGAITRIQVSLAP